MSQPDRASSTETVILGAGGVVFGPSGGVLLVRYRSGAWAFPKGHVEAGETLEDTARREVREEGGVQAEVVAPLSPTRYTNDRGEAREIHWFVMHSQEDTLSLEDTFSEGGYFAPDVAAQMLRYAEDRRLLQDALTTRS
ncbi:NUDIX hydrolase [Deinococcus sp. KNUC1210]|uniref:NUDIX hydrolase n=1 Tax=Deinococcus sp. KNUC1210 TaxID=2917691 RepID=UPI001EF0A7DB|nr:NUDIX hydrolase [Deinococcus sp. KNUC1210]ULH15204.1 NUDIX hydrolase [Deinococcus sp. KNUC1210]